VRTTAFTHRFDLKKIASWRRDLLHLRAPRSLATALEGGLGLNHKADVVLYGPFAQVLDRQPINPGANRVGQRSASLRRVISHFRDNPQARPLGRDIKHDE
jgi:hypothetical protein